MIKASVIVSSYNCNEALANTFTAISRQKTNFDFEVCFLDDCSYEDPKPLYDKYLKVNHKKGWRLKTHIGTLGDSRKFPNMKWFKNSFALSLDMMSKESNIVIFNHGDVLMTTDDTIQKFVDRVKKRTPQIPNVYTRKIPKDLYLDFDEIKKYKINKKEHPLYQGKDRKSLAPTLMAFYKPDLYELEYDKNSSEGQIAGMINYYHKEDYNLENPKDIIGIHQQHKARVSIHLINEEMLLNGYTIKEFERVVY